jgi:hypothetical protein
MDGGNIMTEELTGQDKARLLGNIDARSDDYDRDFYEAMHRIRPLQMDEVDDDIRRAILRFVMDGKGEASKPENGGFVMMGFVHGYMVGRKLKRDIRK